MDQLGAMEPDRLLQVLLAVVGCAVTMFVLTAAYTVLARRSSRRRTGGEGSISPVSPLSVSARDQLGDWEKATSSPQRTVGPSVLDVEARLAGTGRDAWLAQRVDVPAVLPGAVGKEILRIVQDPSTGKIWVTVAGVRYARLSDIRDRSVGERVLAAITYALKFSGGMVATDQGVVSIRLPECDAVAVPAAFGALSEADESGEMMRFIGNTEHNDFWIQIVSRCYRNLSEVADQSVGQRILEGISYLLQFSHGRLSANDGVRVVPVPSLRLKPGPVLSIPLSQQPVEETARRVATPEEEEAFFRQLMNQDMVSEGRQSRRSGLAGAVRKQSEPSEGRGPMLNLAGEIDKILQRKLIASPLASTDAQIVARPDGSVRIRVGTKFYDKPDEVPDVELRRLIQSSIAEW
jgi:hypothetical protein